MSAWGDYSMYAAPEFLWEYQDKIRVVQKDATGYSLLTFINRDAATTAITFDPALDRREQPSGSPAVIYHEDKNWTEFRHTGRDASLTTSKLVTNVDSGGENGGRFLTPRFVGVHDDLGGTTSSAFFWGKLDDNGDHWLGFVYTASMELTDFWVFGSARRPVMKHLHILHQDTTNYDVKVQVDNSDLVETFDWQAAIVGQYVIGAPMLHSGYSKHLIADDPRNLTLTIESSSPGAMNINSLEYDVVLKGK